MYPYYIGIYSLFGFSSTAFHAGSLMLHLLNAILVYFILQHLLTLTGFNKNVRKHQIFIGLVTVLFAIHPLQVESIAWISASKVLLYSTFTLGSLLFYLKYKRSHKYEFLVLTFLGYILSLMTKEQAIILPLNLLLIDFILHTYKNPSFSWRVVLEKIPFLLLAFLFWHWSAQNNLGTLEVEGAYSWDQRLVFGSYSLIVYAIRFILPVNLLYFYGYPIVAGESLSWFYYGYIIVALFMALYIIDLYQNRKFLPFFGLVFFGINILLVLHILPMPRAMITADRYMYLSIIGLSVWAIWGANHIYQLVQQRKWIKTKQTRQYAAGGLIALFLIGCALYSNVLTRKWNTSETIKQEVREYLQPTLMNETK